MVIPPHVGIGTGRVALSTWAEINAAAEQGLIDENEYCELKKALPPKAQNTEIQKDLASLTVLGGCLIIGITDAGGDKAGDVVGVNDPDATKQRLAMLADAVQPSVVCQVYVVLDADDSSRGCVICAVPPSATAPHQVDGKYWGRTSHGKRILTDPEVADLFTKRRHRADDFEQHLRALAEDLNPLQGGDPARGRLYVSARPLQSPLAAYDDPPWAEDAHNPIDIFNAAQIGRGDAWGDLGDMGYSIQHPWGLSSSSVAAGTTELGEYEYTAQRIVIRHDGQVDYAAALGAFTGTDEEHEGVRLLPLAPVLARVHWCLQVAGYLGLQMGYRGAWRVGMWLTNTEGAIELVAFSGHYSGRSSRYAEKEFLNVMDCATGDLENPAGIMARLAKPLARGLGRTDILPYDTVHDLLAREQRLSRLTRRRGHGTGPSSQGPEPERTSLRHNELRSARTQGRPVSGG